MSANPQHPYRERSRTPTPLPAFPNAKRSRLYRAIRSAITKATIHDYSMKNNDIFESQLNSEGSLAGVYEHDHEVGYFYLYSLMHPEGQKIIGALRISVRSFRHNIDDLAIRWNRDEDIVGLFIKEQLFAAFDVKNQKAFGGESEESVSTLHSISKTFPSMESSHDKNRVPP